MIYIVFKVVDNNTGRTYTQCHFTDDIDDGYMGSNSSLRRSLKKHNGQNFEKVILSTHDKFEDMIAELAEVRKQNKTVGA